MPKWSALKAAVDSSNIILVIFICFGSATTSFYWSKWLGKIISRSHMTGEPFKDITKKNEMFSLTVHAVLMILLCLLFPLLSHVYVNPMITEMYGSASDVLGTGILYTLIAIIVLVLAVPVLSYFFSRKMKTNVKLSYMNGINTGENKAFVDSFGEEKKLWLSNYYFHKVIGSRKLMAPVQLLATATLLVMMIMIIGGAI